MTTRPEDCVHATTTTLLWLYGEGPEDHVHHVASCEVCTAVAAEHADVAAAIAPIAPELAAGSTAVVAGASLGTRQPAPQPANRGWWIGVSLGLAAAAAVILGLVGVLGVPGAQAPIARTPDPITVPLVQSESPSAQAPDPAVAQGAPRQVAPLDDVEPEQLIRDMEPDSGTAVEDGRLAEMLLEDTLYAPLDDELDDLFDDFAALEADLTTL